MFADPGVAVGGGPLHGLWPGEPAWRPPAGFVADFSAMSHGDAPWARDLGDFYGANWSIRRAALDAIGGFDERWGAGRHGSLPGEESAAEYAVRGAGAGACGYSPGAAMGHRIEPGRLNPGWLLKRVFRHGLILPHVRAAFAEPDAASLQAGAQRAAQVVHTYAPAPGVLSTTRSCSIASPIWRSPSRRASRSPASSACWCAPSTCSARASAR